MNLRSIGHPVHFAGPLNFFPSSSACRVIVPLQAGRRRVICLRTSVICPPSSDRCHLLLALLAGLVTLVVGFIVSLLFGFLVMIVKIAAGCAGDCAHGQSNTGVACDRANNPTSCSADGSAAQGALFGKQTSLSPPGPDPAAS
jgi:hypothetical protein